MSQIFIAGSYPFICMSAIGLEKKNNTDLHLSCCTFNRIMEEKCKKIMAGMFNSSNIWDISRYLPFHMSVTIFDVWANDIPLIAPAAVTCEN